LEGLLTTVVQLDRMFGFVQLGVSSGVTGGVAVVVDNAQWLRIGRPALQWLHGRHIGAIGALFSMLATEA
jgi:hypothetical protein